MDYTLEKFESDNLLSDFTLTKYNAAAEICDSVMKKVVKACTAGATIRDICSLGDALLLESTGKVFKKSADMERGIAFPTCVNVNNIAQNFSPAPAPPLGSMNEDVNPILAPLDVVNIELGVHIDGYIASSAHTLVVPSPDGIGITVPLTGRPADAICAAHYAAEVAIRMLKPGVKSTDIQFAIQRVAASFNCQPCDDTGSYITQRFILEGDQVIQNLAYGETLPRQYVQSTDMVLRFEAETQDNFIIKPNQVYSINIYTSTGTGQLRDSPIHEIGIFQRNVHRSYNLKLKSARLALSSAMTHFSVFPFSTRGLVDLVPTCKSGLPECRNSDMFLGLPVKEEAGLDINGNPVIIAQFKATVMILANGNVIRITGAGFELPYCHSEYSIGQEFEEILSRAVRGTRNSSAQDGKKAMETD